MPANDKEFNRQFTRIAQSLPEKTLVKFHKRLGLFALRSLVKKTPVDTGRARSNWQVTYVVPAQGVLETTDKRIGPTISKGSQVISQLRPFTVMFITNNVAYIEVLDKGLFDPPNPGESKKKGKGGRKIRGRTGKVLVKDGFSVQAPNGMSALTVAELLAEFGNGR